ncbi:MAG TPA: type II toxin-antitoxin system HicB family antitoxin [Candidatus Paceibacterota bacterium]
MSKNQLKTINQYTAVFEPDLEVGGYTVTIPALPGCVSEGDTFEEAQRNIREAAGLYLETMKVRHKKTWVDKGIVISPIYLGV